MKFLFAKFLLIVGILALTNSGLAADEAGHWPFDQRQIVLVKKENVEFPDAKTVAQIMDVFSRRGRVRWVTLRGDGKGRVEPVEVPGDFEWHSFAAIRKMGLRFKADGLVVLSQRGIQLDLQWFSTKDGQPLFFEKVSLPAASNAEQEAERRKRIQDWLLDIWSKIPGEGYIVSRDMVSLKFEGAEQLGVKIGDQLELLRLGTPDRHPLLKTLVGMESSVTGKAEVTEIGKPFSTAKIVYESKVDPIQPGDRFIRVEKSTSKNSIGDQSNKNTVPATAEEPSQVAPKDSEGRTFLPLFKGGENIPSSGVEAPQSDLEKKSEISGAPPEWNFFDLDVGIHYKRLTHTENTATADTNGASSFTMKAWAPGFDVAARVLLTRQILLGGILNYSLFSYRSLEDIYGVSSISAGFYSFSFLGGYRMFFLEESWQMYPGEILLQLAYKNSHFSMGNLAASDVAPSAKNYSGFEIGFRLQLPVAVDVGFQMGGGLVLAPTLTEQVRTGGQNTSSQFYRFDARVLYKIEKTADLFAGLDIESANTSFTGAGTRTIASSSTSIGATSYRLGYAKRF